jgi:hypothetical protein
MTPLTPIEALEAIMRVGDPETAIEEIHKIATETLASYKGGEDLEQDELWRELKDFLNIYNSQNESRQFYFPLLELKSKFAIAKKILLEALKKIAANENNYYDTARIATEAIKKWEDSSVGMKRVKVSERLPNKSGLYRVWYKNGHTEKTGFDALDKKFRYGTDNVTDLIIEWEDISGKETGIEVKAKIEELEFQVEECQSAINKGDTGDEIRLSINDFVSDLESRIEVLQSRLQSVPPYKEEETKMACKDMACRFFKWYVDDPNEEVTKELANANPDLIIETMYDIWLNKYFLPDTINPPYKEEEKDEQIKKLEEEVNEYSRNLKNCNDHYSKIFHEQNKEIERLKKQPYKDEVDKEQDEEVQRDNSSFYTYFRIDFEDWGEDFDFTICETLDEVREMLQLAEIHLDEPDRHTKVIVTGIPLTPPQYEKFKKGEETNFLESKEEAGRNKKK